MLHIGVAILAMTGMNDRRVFLQSVLGTVGCSGGACAVSLFILQHRRLANGPTADPISSDDELSKLRSQNDLAPARKDLEREWNKLRVQRPSVSDTSDAFGTVVRFRNAIDEAYPLAEARQWQALGTKLPASLVTDFEQAATVLASSAALSEEWRSAIGWQWGACGWRHCGAQADATQAMSKLRANCEMLVPIEAIFYLDVAKRATDEVIAIGVLGGWLPRSALGDQVYLSRETLELILPPEDLQSGDANLPVMRGGMTEAEGSLEEYEAEQLSALNSMILPE